VPVSSPPSPLYPGEPSLSLSEDGQAIEIVSGLLLLAEPSEFVRLHWDENDFVPDFSVVADKLMEQIEPIIIGLRQFGARKSEKGGIVLLRDLREVSGNDEIIIVHALTPEMIWANGAAED
jgi:hypothetical protein